MAMFYYHSPQKIYLTAKNNIKRYLDERLPEEYEKCLVGLTAITIQKTKEKECYSMKLDLLNNATVVDDAIRFVSSKSKENQKSSPSDSNESSANHWGTSSM